MKNLEFMVLPLGQIRASVYNPRRITPEAARRLEKSLETFGIVDPLIVNKRTGYTLVGGHQRMAILSKKGIKEAPCIILDIELEREKALNIALNNQKMAGEYDFPKLADLLLDLEHSNVDLAVTGFDHDEVKKIMEWAPDADFEPTQEQDHEGGGASSQIVDCPNCGHKFSVLKEKRS